MCCAAFAAKIIVASDAGSTGPEGDGLRGVGTFAGCLLVDQGVRIDAAAAAASAPGSALNADAAKLQPGVLIGPAVGKKMLQTEGLTAGDVGAYVLNM